MQTYSIPHFHFHTCSDCCCSVLLVTISFPSEERNGDDFSAVSDSLMGTYLPPRPPPVRPSVPPAVCAIGFFQPFDQDVQSWFMQDSHAPFTPFTPPGSPSLSVVVGASPFNLSTSSTPKVSSQAWTDVAIGVLCRGGLGQVRIALPRSTWRCQVPCK